LAQSRSTRNVSPS